MFSKNTLDDAVSPVVGVILMVAVTVILAAVIASFVLDLGSNVQQNPSAGVTFDYDGSEVTIQVVSAENVDSLEYTLNGGSATDIGSSAGDTATVSASSGDTVTVIGELDGKRSVIQTYEV